MLNEDLEQRELFNKFYEITDQAIDKAVSFQDIDGLSVSQNELIRGCIKTTLVDAKKYNQSKETAVAYSESHILSHSTAFGKCGKFKQLVKFYIFGCDVYIHFFHKTLFLNKLLIL